MDEAAKEPLDKLAEVLHFEPGECTEINSLAVQAIAEIERLRELVDTPMSERERKFLQFINNRDECRSKEYAAFLQANEQAVKLGIAATAIFEMVAEATRSYLCNFDSMTDGNGAVMPIGDAIEEITSRAEFEFHRVTGIDHITGSRDSVLRRKWPVSENSANGKG